MKRFVQYGLNVLVASLAVGPTARAEPSAELRAEASRALKKAATFYRDKVASHGGYVYYYTPDLKQRWGEGEASADTIFVQPPGTPTVGMAYLTGYEATGDKFYLDAARETAEALVYGQLQSGGWTQVIHFAPAKRMGKYRNGKGGNWNASSFDDGQTQAALSFLARVDRAHGFKDAKIHEAALFGFDALLKAQFANGAFPQVWTEPVKAHPLLKANFPDYDWKTEGRVKNYWDYYTLNDNLAGTVAETLIAAHQIYKEDKYKAALEKLGDFLILAQMPDAQPGWCQQYSYEMVPIWARKFEPPAITASESQDVMATLVKIARYTDNKAYLKPVPRAIRYFEKCVLSDGRLARFYELKTNKPLYMNAQYDLTYDDSATPSHYAWKVRSRLKEIEKDYRDAEAGVAPPERSPSNDIEERVRRIIRDLDADGRWISTSGADGLVGQPKFERGFRYISSDVFRRNVETLSAYLALNKK